MTDGEVADPPRWRVPRWAAEVVETLALTIVIFVVIQGFIAQPFKVEQHSMEQTFSEGQYVLVDRLSHLWSPYGQGQVVVFQSAADTGRQEPLIKRVIAVGGQSVDIRGGTVLVDGTPLVEPYLFKGEDGIAEPTDATDPRTTHWDVPVGDLFVLGDHRQVSADSRTFGPIPVSSVIGRAVLRYWPLSALSIVQTPAQR